MIFQIVSYFNKTLRKILVGSYRQERISNEIFRAIIKINTKKKIKILDYGSGFFNPSLAKLISNKLKKKGVLNKFICFDFYKKKELKILNIDKNIKYMHLKQINNINYKFDYCIISDTLHHIGKGVNDLNKLSRILINLKKKSKYIIIKDHFEYDLLSRKLLQILDFFGNYQNKTNIPNKYFTKGLLQELLERSQLDVVKIIEKKKYYRWFFLFFNNPKLHFINILKRK